MVYFLKFTAFPFELTFSEALCKSLKLKLVDPDMFQQQQTCHLSKLVFGTSFEKCDIE